ncbi:MAG TPA: hypothetical protein VEL68_04070, partial [Thermodesulfobacteriota bacterium]|nr:hypothetical protein [Thermodesulfobacteriota bacterium]
MKWKPPHGFCTEGLCPRALGTEIPFPATQRENKTGGGQAKIRSIASRLMGLPLKEAEPSLPDGGNQDLRM